mgnify:CR=1 FL=1
MKIAVFPGSFDPLTNGHLDIITRASTLFDKLIVLIAINPDKKYHIEQEKRSKLIKECVKNLKNVEVTSFTGHTVKFCEEHKANFIIRGIRNKKDYVYEKHLADLYKDENPNIEIIFLNCNKKYEDISSTKINKLIAKNKDISNYVPINIIKAYKKTSK